MASVMGALVLVVMVPVQKKIIGWLFLKIKAAQGYTDERLRLVRMGSVGEGKRGMSEVRCQRRWRRCRL